MSWAAVWTSRSKTAYIKAEKQQPGLTACVPKLIPNLDLPWYKIDRRLDLLINLQLAAAIPVVDASN